MKRYIYLYRSIIIVVRYCLLKWVSTCAQNEILWYMQSKAVCRGKCYVWSSIYFASFSCLDFLFGSDFSCLKQLVSVVHYFSLSFILNSSLSIILLIINNINYFNANLIFLQKKKKLCSNLRMTPASVVSLIVVLWTDSKSIQIVYIVCRMLFLESSQFSNSTATSNPN